MERSKVVLFATGYKLLVLDIQLASILSVYAHDKHSKIRNDKQRWVEIKHNNWNTNMTKLFRMVMTETLKVERKGGQTSLQNSQSQKGNVRGAEMIVTFDISILQLLYGNISSSNWLLTPGSLFRKYFRVHFWIHCSKMIEEQEFFFAL